MKQVLFKTFVTRFYTINTGFFLVTFILLFGLLNGQATIDLHHFLMERIGNSPMFFLGAIAIWCLYAFKCLAFMVRTIKTPANGFLATMQCLPDAQQKMILATCYLAMLVPVLAYGGLAVVVGAAEGGKLLPVLFAMFQLSLTGVSWIAFNMINGTWKEPAFKIPLLLPCIRKPYVSYLLHFSLADRKGTFIGIKLLSLLLLQGIVIANKNTVDRESVCVLMMFLVSAHALLPLYYTSFMESKLSFVRNMPVTKSRLVLTYTVTYMVTFLPELLFLLINSKHAISMTQVMSLYSVAIAQMLLYTAIQYAPGITTERYTMVVFAFFFASLLFLASFNLWPLAITEVAIALMVFQRFYYRYETLKS